MSAPQPNPDLKHARERLREAGLRLTRPRLLIYSLLCELGGHLSVSDLVEQLQQAGHAMPRMTVYNVMSDLETAGLVMTADAGPGRALYEASEVWHHHFVCRRCGEVFDVRCVKEQKPCLEPEGGLPGTIDEAQIIFRGVCFACAGEASPTADERGGGR